MVHLLSGEVLVYAVDTFANLMQPNAAAFHLEASEDRCSAFPPRVMDLNCLHVGQIQNPAPSPSPHCSSLSSLSSLILSHLYILAIIRHQYRSRLFSNYRKSWLSPLVPSYAQLME